MRPDATRARTVQPRKRPRAVPREFAMHTVQAFATSRVNVAIAPVNTCNYGVASGRHTRNFQLHPPRKSGYLCAVAFRLARPSFELKCWNFGLTEKLVKGETK